jgi:signal transduction histidine kinase
MLEIEVSDDGVGFNPADARRDGHGLANMETRTEEMGGALTISSSPGRGTRIVLRAPYEETVQP